VVEREREREGGREGGRERACVTKKTGSRCELGRLCVCERERKRERVCVCEREREGANETGCDRERFCKATRTVCKATPIQSRMRTGRAAPNLISALSFSRCSLFAGKRAEYERPSKPETWVLDQNFGTRVSVLQTS